MKLPLVQVLRALAALLVVMHHAQNEGAALAARIGSGFSPSHLLPWSAGVDIFFVISGFIIVHASAPLYGRLDAHRRFMAHRVARLVPLYWLVSAVYLAVALTVPARLSNEGSGFLDGSHVLASFLFWPAMRADGFPLPLYSLGWTLNCEMFFYVLFAVAIGWGRRAAVAWVCGALALFTLAKAMHPNLPMPLAFWGGPLVLEFALGALLGLARAEGARLDGWVRSGIGLTAIVLLWLSTEPVSAMRPVVYGLPAALLVAAAALGRSEPAQQEHTMGWQDALRIPVAVGDASYALYLVHPFVLRAGREAILAFELAPAFGVWGSILLAILGAVVISVAVHHWIERPMTRYARALLDPRVPEPVSAGRAADDLVGRVPKRVSSDGERIQPADWPSTPKVRVRPLRRFWP